ncbi:MAG: hypothetical protein NTZ49_01710 [Candidatus Parcubacteria bacterium]|nr:hypothetical protein [Candidatus Parcubacteria bacterium]
MLLKGIPFLRQEQIVFPEGTLSLEQSRLLDLQKLLEQEGFIDPELPLLANHRCFNHLKGKILALFAPGTKLQPESEILALDYLLGDNLFLSRFLSFYHRTFESVPRILLEGDKFVAILGLNLQLTCEKGQSSVESLSFVSSKHITVCSCDICETVRMLLGYQKQGHDLDKGKNVFVH